MPKRRPTARSADDRLHRNASRGRRSRADLPRPADCSVELIFACRRRPRPRRQGFGPVRTGRRNDRDDQARPRWKQGPLWSAQGLAPAAAGEEQGRPLHRRTAHAKARIARVLARTRGRKTTTIPDSAGPCPEDKVERAFKADAPDKLWVAASAYVQTAMAMACAAVIIDVFARKIVGWRVSTPMTTSFVLDALNQAICRRRPAQGGLIHHSDRGMLCLSIRCAEQLAEVGIDHVGRKRHRTVQDRSRKTLRPLGNRRPCRMGSPEMGALMQQRETARSHRIQNAKRNGGRFPQPATDRA